jgi:RNA polymerase sigma-32 factor
MMTTLSLPAVPLESGLSRYFREIWKFPILDAAEEYMLAKRWREHDDVDAAHKMVTSHLRLVAKIAMKYRGYGLPMSDLVSEGNVGLMKAVKKFEPERGFRLSTYAIWWIKAAITEHILKSWSLVKMGTVAAQKKLFFSLRRLKSHLDIVDNGELEPEQVRQLATALDVPEGELVEMNRRLAARDASLNAKVSYEDDGIEFQDTLVDEGPSPEEKVAVHQELGYRRSLLKKALAALPERDRRIFVERQLSEEPATLEELGQEYGISRERVRQLEARAFTKVQKAIQVAMREAGGTMALAGA